MAFTLTYFTGPHGDQEDSRPAPTAQRALELAEAMENVVTITAPDGRDYDLSDFRIAVDAGAFDA